MVSQKSKSLRIEWVWPSLGITATPQLLETKGQEYLSPVAGTASCPPAPRPSVFLTGPRAQLRKVISQLSSRAGTTSGWWEHSRGLCLSYPSSRLLRLMDWGRAHLPTHCLCTSSHVWLHWRHWGGRDFKRPLGVCVLLLGSWHPPKKRPSLAVVSPSWGLEGQAWKQICPHPTADPDPWVRNCCWNCYLFLRKRGWTWGWKWLNGTGRWASKWSFVFPWRR